MTLLGDVPERDKGREKLLTWVKLFPNSACNPAGWNTWKLLIKMIQTETEFPILEKYLNKRLQCEIIKSGNLL